MKVPKNRRKTYRYFQNFDVMKYEGEWFIQFPNEREYIHFGDERFKRFESAVLEEVKRMPTMWVDGREAPVLVPTDLRPFVTRVAKELLAK